MDAPFKISREIGGREFTLESGKLAKLADGAVLITSGETSVLDYLEAQLAFNEVVRQYRDALVRHRRAILDLNTAVGERILP